MRIALVGAGGQLGQDLQMVLPGDVIPLVRAQLDLTKPSRIATALHDAKPDVVINCAAYNFVDKAESEASAAFDVNSLGVRELAIACADMHCTLVHFSTDYVFGLSASRRLSYTETDAPGPVSVYGSSKLAGEAFVRAICPKHFVIRTCGLYGHKGQGGKGGNFVETILKRARSGAPLRVVDDQRCTPTATADLAGAVTSLIRTEEYGLYHVTNAGSCTWYEFAAAILKLGELRTELAPIRSAEFGAKARRPSYSVLDCAKFTRVFQRELRPWLEALESYLRAV